MYQPTAATGNSRSLLTLGGHGEIMGFFYPRIDFAQNVREGMFAVYLPHHGGGRLEWCFSEVWSAEQSFKKSTNVLVTRLKHVQLDLTVEVTDLLPPGQSALVRHFALHRGPSVGPATLYQYFNLTPGDVSKRNAVQWLPDRAVVVQQFRDVVLAVGASTSFGVASGTVDHHGQSAVKRGMTHGAVHGSDQCMGDVEFAVAFETGDQPAWDVTLVLGGGASRDEAASVVTKLCQTPRAQLERAAVERSERFLATAPACQTSAWQPAYERAILSVMDLFDEREGTFIAAPECDPFYAHSGGYGYCWPRDAAVVAVTMARLGFRELAERFFDWCMVTQMPDGHWYQRYWTNRVEAPAWCVRHDEIQLDQTCAVLHAAGHYARTLGERAPRWIARFRPVAERAVRAIVDHLEPSGLHKQAADLWECCYGSFAYTNAGVIAALREGAEVFGQSVPDLARLQRAMYDHLYRADAKRWARRIVPGGQRDDTMDSSALGLIEPWDVLDLAEAESLEIARATVESIDDVLAVDGRAGKVILRFEHESYMGGAPGCVNTLWSGLCRLRLAAATRGEERARHLELADERVEAALAYTNPVGQLPELIPRNIAQDYWAAPHGWASSLLIQCVLLRNQLEADGEAGGAATAGEPVGAGTSA